MSAGDAILSITNVLDCVVIGGGVWVSALFFLLSVLDVAVEIKSGFH